MAGKPRGMGHPGACGVLTPLHGLPGCPGRGGQASPRPAAGPPPPHLPGRPGHQKGDVPESGLTGLHAAHVAARILPEARVPTGLEGICPGGPKSPRPRGSPGRPRTSSLSSGGDRLPCPLVLRCLWARSPTADWALMLLQISGRRTAERQEDTADGAHGHTDTHAVHTHMHTLPMYTQARTCMCRHTRRHGARAPTRTRRHTCACPHAHRRARTPADEGPPFRRRENDRRARLGIKEAMEQERNGKHPNRSKDFCKNGDNDGSQGLKCMSNFKIQEQ